MQRVLLIQPSLQPPGGGNVVAAWMVQALRGHADISILTWKGIDLEPINRLFGTTLAPHDFTLHVIPPTTRRLVDRIPTPHAMLQMHTLLRRARQLHRRTPFDLMLTANNEADFGERGIQYVHYPWASFPRPALDLRWFHYIPGALRGYWALCGLLSEFSWPRMRRNLTLVNSEYIAEKTRAAHGIDPIVLHPPVPGDFPEVPWDARKNGFVCIGRLSHEKEQIKVIRIIDGLRTRGHDVHLHLVGSASDSPFVTEVRAHLQTRTGHVTLHQDIPRAELLDLLTSNRYGIHGMVGEHFGIAVAELQRAGCITFVPDVGGPRDIVGGDPRLLYTSEQDAIDRIDRVLGDPAAQDALAAHVRDRRDVFSCERFVTGFRAHVATFPAADVAP